MEDGEEHVTGDRSNGAPEGGVGSHKQPSLLLSNPNQMTINKNIKIAELSRETHLVQMTPPCIMFC
jgi:hypothetical protein